jgi:hypothetical protein
MIFWTERKAQVDTTARMGILELGQVSFRSLGCDCFEAF